MEKQEIRKKIEVLRQKENQLKTYIRELKKSGYPAGNYSKVLTELTRFIKVIEDFVNNTNKEDAYLYENTINILSNEYEILLNTVLNLKEINELSIDTIINKLSISEREKEKIRNILYNLLYEDNTTELKEIISLLSNEEVIAKLLLYNNKSNEDHKNECEIFMNSYYVSGIINNEKVKLLDKINYTAQLLINSEKNNYDENKLKKKLLALVAFPTIIDSSKEEFIEKYYNIFLSIKRYNTPVFDDPRFLSDILEGPVLEEGESDYNSSLVRLYMYGVGEGYLDKITRENLIVHRNNQNQFIWSMRLSTDENSVRYYINNEEVSVEDIKDPSAYLEEKRKRKV